MGTVHFSSIAEQAARLGAFCPDNQVAVRGSGHGPLAGLTFAAKDVFDIAGTVTGNGNPDWLRTHRPAARSAVAVERLLAAGADLVGRTITDELAYSLTGENFHYGTPLNPRDPTRVPGGSSSGSASIAAAGLVDFALGSDCGGSVRVPASYCGIAGMRATHGRIPTAGVVPFAPSFDSVGWFARDMGVFERVGRVLLEDDAAARPIRQALVATDALALLDAGSQAAMAPALARIGARIDDVRRITLAEDGLDSWSATFRTIQAAEIWDSVGAWIEATRPIFGPGVRERFEAASRSDPDAVMRARAHRQAIVRNLDALLVPGTVLVMPTVPRVAPERNARLEDIEVTYRNRAMGLLCAAGLAGLPQISLPLAEHEGLPLGLSLIGARNRDIDLIALARTLCGQKNGT